MAPEEKDRFEIVQKIIDAQVKHFTCKIHVQDGYVVLVEEIKVSDQQKIKR